MIISKTPLRISFVGGGSDLPSFYKLSEGAVISTTISKHIYITVNKKFDNYIRVSYSRTENVKNVSQIEHPIVREALKKLNINGIEITSVADIPSEGSGLGSSSAFTVGLLHALYAYQQKYISLKDLAHMACEIEIDILKEPIGKQDQFGTVFGGLKFLRFHADGNVSIDPILCLRKTKETIQRNMLLFYTGITRRASKILVKQKTNMELDKRKYKIMKKMVQLAHDLYNDLKKDEIDNFGEILHSNWMYKKEMADSISNCEIDQWYETARKHGAKGGKILGAGGGGFLLFYAPQEKHETLKQALSGLIPVDFQFDNQGSKIIFTC